MKALIKNHFFWKLALTKPSVFDTEENVLYSKIQTIIKFTYLCFLLLTFFDALNWFPSEDLKMSHALWPVSWLQNFSLQNVILFFKINLISVFTFLAFNHNNRFLRIYGFFIFFLYVAVSNSFGKINHSSHLLLLILFGFALMPSKRDSQKEAKTILMFSTTQFFLLCAYSLTGFWKVFWGIIELFTKPVSLFSPLSFRNTLIEKFETTEPTILGAFFIENYTFGYVFFLIVLYIELFSIFVIFKPRLHKIWGILLILVHAGISLIMNVTMSPAPLWIGVLLILSPFNLEEKNIKKIIIDLPVISQINWLLKRN